MISPSLTIFGIQVVSTENTFCLESTISAYSGLSVPLKINLIPFYSILLLLIISFFVASVCEFAALIMARYLKSHIYKITKNHKRFLRMQKH